MKKKGFTLAELLGVIVLLSALLLIIIPVVTKQLKEGNQALYNNQIDFIKQAMQLWAEENYKPKNGETIYLTLSQLKQAGFVEHDLQNPNEKTYFANDMILTISNTNGILSYNISDMGDYKYDYLDVPKITILGDVVTHIELNSNYIDLGSTAKDKDGNTIDDIITVVDENFDNSIIGSYYINYVASDNGKTNIVKRTVIVEDKTGPIISFSNNLTISLSQINSYNFTSDVVVTDNSNEEVDLQVEKDFTNLRGTYSIKYIATDIYGNVSTKVRKVIVN